MRPSCFPVESQRPFEVATVESLEDEPHPPQSTNVLLCNLALSKVCAAKSSEDNSLADSSTQSVRPGMVRIPCQTSSTRLRGEADAADIATLDWILHRWHHRDRNLEPSVMLPTPRLFHRLTIIVIPVLTRKHKREGR